LYQIIIDELIYAYKFLFETEENHVQQFDYRDHRDEEYVLDLFKMSNGEFEF